MKLLILVHGLEKEAAGLVFSAFLKELSQKKELDVSIITDYVFSFSSDFNNVITIPPSKEIPYKLYKLLMIATKKNYLRFFWKRKVKSKLDFLARDSKKFDWVITFGYADAHALIQLGDYAAIVFSSKHYIHLVDPIPSPPGWEHIERYRANKIYSVKKALENCTLLSLSNDTMRAYQLKFLNKKPSSFTLPNPTLKSKLVELPKKNNNDKFVFLYLGTLTTGARRPEKLFEAFSKIIDRYPNSYIQIYGRSVGNLHIPDEIKTRVIFKGFTNDIDKAIKFADAFIDLDADLESDVFISSKLQVYLSYNRPILSITGHKSPSRLLLKDFPKSAIISSFDVDEIATSMIEIIKAKVDNSFIDERNQYLEKNNSKYLSNLLLDRLVQESS